MADAATLPVQLPAPPVPPPAAGIAASVERAASPQGRPRNPSGDDQPKDRRFSDALNQARDRNHDADRQERRRPPKAGEEAAGVAAQQGPQEFRQLTKPGADGAAEATCKLDVDALSMLLMQQLPEGSISEGDIKAALQALPEGAGAKDVFAALVGLLKDDAAPVGAVTVSLLPVTEETPHVNQPQLLAAAIKAGTDELPQSTPGDVPASAPLAVSTPAINRLLGALSEFFAAPPTASLSPDQPVAVLPVLPPRVETAAAAPLPSTNPLAALPVEEGSPAAATPPAAIAGNTSMQGSENPVAGATSSTAPAPGVHYAPPADAKTAPAQAPALVPADGNASSDASAADEPASASAAPAFLPMESDTQEEPQGDGGQNPSSDARASVSVQPPHTNGGRAAENNAPSFARVFSETQANNLADQMVAHVRSASRNGESRIEVQLTPEELGKVQIRLSVVDGRATMQITADNPKTLDMLRSDVRQLENMLRDVGLKTDAGSLSFNLRDEGQPGQQQQQGQGHAYRGKTVDALEEAMNQQAYRAYTLTEAEGLDIRI